MFSFVLTGAGVYIFTSSGPAGSQPNNGLARSRVVTNGRRLRFVCRSDSTAQNVGELIGLNGTVITSSSFFDIDNSNPGELDVNNRVDSQDPLTASEQGVYTCRIPLESGEMREINIGVYPDTFNGEFIVTVNSGVFIWWLTGSTHRVQNHYGEDVQSRLTFMHEKCRWVLTDCSPTKVG